MKFESTHRIAILRNVFASLAVTGFARDSELCDSRIPLVACDKTRLPLRDIAIHARPIPRPERIIFLQLRRNQERLADGRPHLFCDDVGEGKLLQSAALTA